MQKGKSAGQYAVRLQPKSQPEGCYVAFAVFAANGQAGYAVCVAEGRVAGRVTSETVEEAIATGEGRGPKACVSQARPQPATSVGRGRNGDSQPVEPAKSLTSTK